MVIINLQALVAVAADSAAPFMLDALSRFANLLPLDSAACLIRPLPMPPPAPGQAAGAAPKGLHFFDHQQPYERAGRRGGCGSDCPRPPKRGGPGPPLLRRCARRER